MSFPDPHHPWDPPQSELNRIDFKNVPLPQGYIQDENEREQILNSKPRHWNYWYTGKLVSNYEAPPRWIPASLTADQLREITALNAVEVELIDDAVGRVWDYLCQIGIEDDVDVIFTTDHGELGGDFGLLFKGPYHVDGLMRLPLIWKPAKSKNITPAVVTTQVGLVDLAPTFCEIAAIDIPEWMQGEKLPISDEKHVGRPQITQWDSELFGVGVHLRTLTFNNKVLTMYLPGTVHDGTEGELYDLDNDPLQQVNLFEDPTYKTLRDDLTSLLLETSYPTKDPRPELQAPV
jgi:arylsulfatase A-like enzyme